MVLSNFQCRGFLLVSIIIGQCTAVLAVGAGRDGLDIFFSFLFSYAFFWPDIDLNH